VRVERNRERVLPSFPLGPGRAPLSRRSRHRLALALALLVVAAAAVGAAALMRGPAIAPRVVTIPAADRSASPALLRAAEAVGFEPVSESGAGQVESERVFSSRVASDPTLLRVGSLAPRFLLRTPTGAKVDLRSLRGKAVLLEFFATWCPHCNAEAPHLVALARSLPASRYAFLSVDADGETAPSVLAFHIYYGFDFPALLDPSSDPGSFHSPGGPGPVTRAYRVHVFPTFYALSPSGRVSWAAEGEQPDELLRDELLRAARQRGSTTS
jgi:thiol-disulfide isomerase/thioredoxin